MTAAYLRSAPVLPSTNIRHWCWGKQRFDSAVLASSIAARSNRGPRCHYRCRTCGGFHVGAAGAALSNKGIREMTR